MNTLAGQLESNLIRRHLVRDGERILVGVSGGLDSMVLLHLLREMTPSHGWKLAVAHFNHGLRGAAGTADAQLVRRTAKQWKLPFHAARGDTGKFARQNKLSLEMAARQLRHEFLAKTAVKLKISTVILAHHADDQVEHFFLRLFRGSGGDGLAGMRWISPSPVNKSIRLIRPLLNVHRQVLAGYQVENKIPFAEDGTNANFEIPRNRIRHELLPLLSRHYHRACAPNILRAMELIGGEADYARSMAAQWLKRPDVPFADLPEALQRRAVYQQLIEKNVAADFDLVERLRHSHGQWIAVSAVCSVQLASDGRIGCRRPEPVHFNPEPVHFMPARRLRQIAFQGLKLSCQIADYEGMGKSRNGGCVEYFDADKVGGPIRLRGWHPGDRFQPIGNRTASKLQDLFTNAKVPRAERHRKVVAEAANGQIFWVEGLRMAENFKLDPHTRQALKWSWRRPGNQALS